MNQIELIRQRFTRDDVPRRLGAIAANLARISSFVDSGANLKAVRSLLRESEYFIEWTVVHVPIHVQAKLVETQIRSALWFYRLEHKRDLSREMSAEFQKSSDEVLAMSGLVS